MADRADLGSHILSLVRRRLPGDWTARSAVTPVLCETFVQVPRCNGGVYRASGWIRVGTTLGRGRCDRDKKADKPKKDIWLCPLRKDWKRTLNRALSAGSQPERHLPSTQPGHTGAPGNGKPRTNTCAANAHE